MGMVGVSRRICLGQRVRGNVPGLNLRVLGREKAGGRQAGRRRHGRGEGSAAQERVQWQAGRQRQAHEGKWQRCAGVEGRQVVVRSGRCRHGDSRLLLGKGMLCYVKWAKCCSNFSSHFSQLLSPSETPSPQN